MKQAKVITFANQKGGVGKTMSTISIGMGLAESGKKVLLIDTDPQANLTMSVGYDPDELNYTLSDLLLRTMQESNENIEKYITPLEENRNIFLLASDMNLAGVQLSMHSMQLYKEYLLKSIIEKIQNQYDYILIDSPPSIDTLTINALVASDEVIIPTQPQIFSFKGSVQLWQHIQNIKKRLNPSLQVRGILITMWNKVSKNNKEIINAIKEVYGEHVYIFPNYIPASVKAGESNFVGQSILSYDKNGKIAEAYRKCAEEILKNE